MKLEDWSDSSAPNGEPILVLSTPRLRQERAKMADRTAHSQHTGIAEFVRVSGQV